MDSRQMWGMNTQQPQNNFGMGGNGGMPYQQPAKAILPGRIITNMQEMRPQDVPMDGSPAVFPTNDGIYIYVKYWDQDCNLQTVRYKRDDSPITMPEKPKDSMQIIMERLDSMEQRIAASEQKNLSTNSSAQQYYGSKEGEQS